MAAPIIMDSVSTGSKLRDSLENLIATGEMPPGERLDEVKLATRFGVSRTPIREALMQLASAGLVELRHRRSAIVAELGTSQLVEMFEVMAALEALAARLASRRHISSDRGKLIAAHEACERAMQSGDTDAYYYENENFHHTIYLASHNACLNEQCLILSRRLKPYRRIQLRVHDRVQNSYAEHDQIVTAILSRDAESAERYALAHVTIQGERFGDFMASLRVLSAVE